VANINIARVADSSLDFDTPGLSQGDSRFGDIRFGGYQFLNDATTLAQTYYPPPNGLTAAGNIEINMALNFNLGADYDLYSVMLHETGHALGLEHATNPAEVMYPNYQGIRAGLSPGDIAGIRAIYGPRTADAYQEQGQGLGSSSAIDLTPRLDATNRLLLADPSLATIGDTEYFSVVAPAIPGTTLQVTASAGNVSLLSPKVSLFDATGQALDVEADPAAWGNDVTAQSGQVVPGRRYVIAVTGATNDVFAVGAYQLHVAFTGGSSPLTPTPTPPTPPTPTPTPTPTPSPTTSAPALPPVTAVAIPSAPIAPDRFEPNDTLGQATPLGKIAATTVEGLSLDTASDRDGFSFKVARAGVYRVSAPGTSIRVLDGSWNPIASGQGSVSVRLPRARSYYYVEVGAPGGVPVAAYSLSIAPQLSGRLVSLPGGGAGVPRHGSKVRWPAVAHPRLRASAPGIHRP
jgi:hypothetical protein